MIDRFLQILLSRVGKWGTIVHHAVLPECRPQYPAKPWKPPQAIDDALLAAGIRRLYRHQTNALDSLRRGASVVVATPTASGKSLIYNIAVAEALLADSQQRALYLFPTKALSRDQLGTVSDFLTTMAGEPPLRAAIYDGDTDAYQRAKIRQQIPHVLLTNPDMLHYALLAYHAKWVDLWRHLRLVVVDEMHTYRGIFGSHVGQIIRRLRRICRFYGSDPQFALLSATIANPGELAEQLIQRPVTVIQEHCAPQPKRHFLFLQPEESPSAVAAHLVVLAARQGLKTIAFTQSRKLTELVHMSVQRMAPELRHKVSSYRAGFLPEERRVIEQNLASGSLSAVISTSALEVGIDIGILDLCILVGYPGTIMTTWQRGGRVGRGGQESAIILVPGEDALDQYIIHHPQEFLGSHYEVAVVDPDNPEILRAHLPCAAAELPLERTEWGELSEATIAMIEQLTADGELRQSADGDRWLAAVAQPHRQVDLRSVGDAYTILTRSLEDDGKWVPLGKSDGMRALKECHAGAIYLHRGQQYQVAELDLKNRVIRAVRGQVPYFTRVQSEKETTILEVLASKPVANFIIRLGRLRVTEQILGYEKRRLFTQELLDQQPLELPPQTFETVGFWMEIENSIAKAVRDANLHFMGGIHAVEHAAISMFPLFALCDRNDIGGIAYPLHPQLEKSAVFIYDGYPGGIGLAARGYAIITGLLEKTRDLIASCPCEQGCPACIHSPKCGAGNKPLDKTAALKVLQYLLGDLVLPNFSSAAVEEKLSAIALKPEDSKPDLMIGFFDLETQRLADEVGGWQNKHLMRVSVAVLGQGFGEDYRIYREDDMDRLIQDLQSLDLIVGFNVKSFDYSVLRAYSSFDFRKLPTFDILEQIHQHLGFRLSLDHVAENTLGHPKQADGIQAVKWFREGQWEPLIRYCEDDVRLTREVFRHCLEKGYLVYADRKGNQVRLPTPWKLADLIEKCKQA